MNEMNEKHFGFRVLQSKEPFEIWISGLPMYLSHFPFHKIVFLVFRNILIGNSRKLIRNFELLLIHLWECQNMKTCSMLFIECQIPKSCCFLYIELIKKRGKWFFNGNSFIITMMWNLTQTKRKPMKEKIRSTKKHFDRFEALSIKWIN